ncbi:hypothetical protein ZIOFF_005049 [Zingiber officinale]|uniref:Uncharacterized protein n=1 Tax=Zingiber officinale TaxID=94328 RepID=A0A8J5IBU3_ZINOF|nr:hypothetical protein ZIOFF_005049 [Zingiber officinale]
MGGGQRHVEVNPKFTPERSMGERRMRASGRWSLTRKDAWPSGSICGRAELVGRAEGSWAAEIGQTKTTSHRRKLALFLTQHRVKVISLSFPDIHLLTVGTCSPSLFNFSSHGIVVMVGVGLDACCHCAHASARMKDQFSSSDVFFKDLKSLKKVAQLAVSDAAMLAPEEIFHGKGNIKEDAELTKEERKRRRANQKRRFRRLKEHVTHALACVPQAEQPVIADSPRAALEDEVRRLMGHLAQTPEERPPPSRRVRKLILSVGVVPVQSKII